MSEQVSDHLIKRINEWGFKRIFGFPGDGINGIIGAIDRAGDKVDYVQTRHEELAAFMACAHSKFTGEVGICLATSGPGAIHLLNGLYDAKMDHQSVVAIIGQQARAALGGS
jgi:pyruvate dehydrogenase (quinone)